jgi:hypothetical protein
MTALKRRPAHAGRVAPWAWIAVALAPAGWVLGIALALLSGEGQATGIGAVTVGIVGILLFVAAPAAAVILAVRAARPPAARSRPAAPPAPAPMLMWRSSPTARA